MKSKCQYQLWLHLKNLIRPVDFLTYKSNQSSVAGIRDLRQRLNRQILEAKT